MKFRSAATITVVALTLLGCKEGVGLDAKIDASKGYDVNYHASLQKAVDQMSPVQIQAYTSAVYEVTEGVFVSRYGRTTTPRIVIQERIDAWTANADEQYKLAKQEEVKLADEIASREKFRQEAINLLKRITASNLRLVYAKPTQVCEGVVCRDVTPVELQYVINFPAGLELSHLACEFTVTSADGSQTLTFRDSECKAGQWFYKKSPEIQFDIRDAQISASFDIESARTGRYGLEPAIPAPHPVTEKLNSIKKEQELIESYRKAISS